jgi:hypothetical protein
VKLIKKMNYYKYLWCKYCFQLKFTLTLANTVVTTARKTLPLPAGEGSKGRGIHIEKVRLISFQLLDTSIIIK